MVSKGSHKGQKRKRTDEIGDSESEGTEQASTPKEKLKKKRT